MKDRKSGVLQSMGSQRARHDLATEQQQAFIMMKCPTLDNTRTTSGSSNNRTFFHFKEENKLKKHEILY